MDESTTAPLRVYRVPAGSLVLVTLVIGVGGLQLLGSAYFVDDLPPLFVFGAAVFVSPLFLLLAGIWRARTTVHENGLGVRRLLGTTWVGWRDVGALGPEATPGSSRTMVLTRDGRLLPLPAVGIQQADVSFLTALWQRGRGDGWTPPDDCLVRLAGDRHRARTAATVSAIWWYGGSALLLVAALLIFGASASQDEMPPVFHAFFCVPVLAACAGHRSTLRRRLRALT